MRSVSVVEVKSHFSAFLAVVEAGEEVVITRHGRPVAHLVPPLMQTAAEVFQPLWTRESIDEFDVMAPEDSPAEPVATFD
jgi:prevent-host-death family protein